MADPLPTEAQRKQLCEMMYKAFVELRYLVGKRANDLAYAFHNMPKEIYGWGIWSIADTRRRLSYYMTKYKNTGINYVALFDKIFPPQVPLENKQARARGGKKKKRSPKKR